MNILKSSTKSSLIESNRANLKSKGNSHRNTGSYIRFKVSTADYMNLKTN